MSPTAAIILAFMVGVALTLSLTALGIVHP